MSGNLHIVCLDAPSPPDYGGAIDMFYKIKALYEIGWKITLHYFSYNPVRHTKGLENFCVAIYGYKRKPIVQSLPLLRPFIVESRVNNALVQRLNGDDHPVLLEGLHCAGLLPFLHRKERVIHRMHNDEASYYGHLAKTERSLWKRLYFRLESRLLRNYQKGMNKAIKLACLSEADISLFEREYGFRHLFFLPCFLPWQNVTCAEGKGDYCLYHGNLSVSENEEAVRWLVQNVFRHIPVPLVVAGKNIPKQLYQLADKHANIMFVNNPPEDEMQALVRDAQVHVLPSMNSTGIKLKLLNALLNGRFCITNKASVRGSGIHGGLLVHDDPSDWIATIIRLMEKEFTASETGERKAILSLYNNLENAEKLSAAWKHCP